MTIAASGGEAVADVTVSPLKTFKAPVAFACSGLPTWSLLTGYRHTRGLNYGMAETPMSEGADDGLCRYGMPRLALGMFRKRQILLLPRRPPP